MYFWHKWLCPKTLKSPLDCKEIKPVNPKGNLSWILIGRTDAEAIILWPPDAKGIHWKDWCSSWNSNTLATWCEEMTHLKRPWCWERLKAGGEGDDRGWDGWMASQTQWTWVWVNSESCWWTGRPGMLQFMGSKESDTTEQLNWEHWVEFPVLYTVSAH